MVSSIAQVDYVPEEFPMPDHLNTIGTNLTPIIVGAMNSFPAQPRYGLYYKRQNKPYRKLRVQVNFETLDQYDAQRDNAPVSWSDSTITYILRDRFHFNSDIRLGMEFFKPGQKTTMVYGFDVFAGLAVRRDANLTTPYYLESAIDTWVPSPFVEPISNSTEVIYGYVGLDFSIAQKVFLRDQVYLTIQWTPELAYLWPIYESYSSPTARIESPQPSLSFRLRGIEVYLQYMF